MTVQEFSNGFDTLLGQYVIKIPFGNQNPLDFDEYEKSYFLTESEKALVVGLYSGRNPLGLSFEETEELRRYLAPLVAEVTLSPVENSGGMPLGGDSKHFFFTLPDGRPSGNSSGTTAETQEDNNQGETTGEDDNTGVAQEEDTEVQPGVWFITYESVKVNGSRCGDGYVQEVIPATQDEVHRLRKNPFRGLNNRRALRLDLKEGLVEIISKFTVTEYYVRYLRKPKPIVLEVMPDGLSVDGEVNPRGCELHEALHQRVLEGAVEMAVRSRAGTMPQPTQSNQERRREEE